MNLLPGLRPFILSRICAVLVLNLGALSSGCKGIHFNEEQSYGLRLVTLDITPEEYGLLNGQLLSKRPAQVGVRIAGEFEVNCSASYAGRSSLDSYRKSYDVNFCDKEYHKRSHYRLSAQAMDKTMLRSLIGYEVFKSLGLEVPMAEQSAAYINNKYLGVYLFMETIDKEFFKVHKFEVNEIYKARYGNASFHEKFASKLPEAFSYEGRGKDNYVFLEMIYKILWLEARDDYFAARLDAILDIDSFLSYMAVAVYLNHWDGFDNNYFLAFDENRKKLVTVPWDLDRIWEKPDEFAVKDLTGRNALLTRLLGIASYKNAFLTKVTKLSVDFPLDKLVLVAQVKEAAAHDAYAEDPILSRYRASAFQELADKMKIWDLKIKDYLIRNPL